MIDAVSSVPSQSTYTPPPCLPAIPQPVDAPVPPLIQPIATVRRCIGCGKEFCEDLMVCINNVAWRCRVCAEGIMTSHRKKLMLQQVGKMMDKLSDNRVRRGKNWSVVDVSAAALEEFQGPFGFGRAWAKQLKIATRNKPGSNTALRGFADLARFLMKVDEFDHSVAMDNMTEDEIRTAQREAVVKLLADMVYDEQWASVVREVLDSANFLSAEQASEIVAPGIPFDAKELENEEAIP